MLQPRQINSAINPAKYTVKAKGCRKVKTAPRHRRQHFNITQMTAVPAIFSSSSARIMQIYWAYRGGFSELKNIPKRISWWNKLKLAVLKFLAITLYLFGKYLCRPTQPGNTSTINIRFNQVSNNQAARHISRKHSPNVAIVIPVYLRTLNDELNAVQLLLSLQAQSYQSAIVVLVDDCSPRNCLRKIAQQTLGNSDLLSKLVVKRLGRNSGPANARNTGIDVVLAANIANAAADPVSIICFADADCRLSSDWTASMAAAQQKSLAIYSGLTIATDRYADVGLYHDIFGTLNGRRVGECLQLHEERCSYWKSHNALIYGPTCNLSVPLDIAAQLRFDNSFPAASMEDVDFCLRAAKRGIPTKHVRDAIVFHAYDLSWPGFCRQFLKYGKWEYLVCERHAEYQILLGNSISISSIETEQ